MPIPFYIAPPHHVVFAPAPARRLQYNQDFQVVHRAAQNVVADNEVNNQDAPVAINGDVGGQPNEPADEWREVFEEGIFDRQIAAVDEPAVPPQRIVIDQDAIIHARDAIRNIEAKLKLKHKPMQFDMLSVADRILIIKREFSTIVKLIFEHPESLKLMVTEKKLTNKQSKAIFAYINKLNAMNCACCRKFDSTLLKATPIEKELEPLLDIAQNNVKMRTY